jgi:hypothetical protein
MSTSQKLDKTGHDTTFDHFFDGGILFFREELPKFGRGVELALRILREDATDHLLVELGDHLSDYDRS